jgi:hypothetical protein
MQCSIRGLMGAVLVVAFGLVAVRGASPPARWLVATATCLFGLVELLTASARPRWRFAGTTFACVGSLYLALCFGPGLDLSVVTYLPSSAALDRLFTVLFPESYIEEVALREYCTCHDCIAGVRYGLQARFLPPGHVVCALLAAALSGLAAWGLSSHREVGLRNEVGAEPNHDGLESAKPDLQSMFKKPRG